MEFTQERKNKFAYLRKRIATQISIAIVVLILLLSGSWIWRTIAMRSELAKVLARSVERDLQIGDLRSTIINLDRAGGELFEEINYVENGSESRFVFKQGSKPFVSYSVDIAVRNPKSDALDCFLKFEVNPFESIGYFLLIISPILAGIGFIEYKRSIRHLFNDIAHFSAKQAAEAREALAKQVAHDIRSPLSALNMVVTSLIEVSEEKRELIRGASRRINDIANDLLKMKLDPQDVEELAEVKGSPIILSASLEAIVKEKRLQFQDRKDVDIRMDLGNLHGLLVNIAPVDFLRVISNLINNAVEAIDGAGEVVIAVRSSKERVSVIVRDTGKGIPPDVLIRLGERGITYGKSGAQSGSGLGIPHASEFIKASGGSLNIQSQQGMGTLVTITLPRTQAVT